jgi:hypothetical protein
MTVFVSKARFVLPVLILAACSQTDPTTAGDESEAAMAEPLTEMAMNSAKRQCTSVAVMQQVESDAAKDVCNCTVNRLVSDGHFTSQRGPTDAEQQAALDSCIDQHQAAAG